MGSQKKKTADEKRLHVVVTVDLSVSPDFQVVESDLRRVGLSITSSLTRLGVITGDILERDYDRLEGVTSVKAVRQEAVYTTRAARK